MTGKIWVYFCRLLLDCKPRRNNWRVRTLDSRERKKEKDDRLRGREMIGSDRGYPGTEKRTLLPQEPGEEERMHELWVNWGGKGKKRR